MNITKITNNQDLFSDKEPKSIENKKKELIGDHNRKKDSLSASDSIGKNILLATVEKLENSIHLDDNHPLDKINAAPLDTLEDVIVELNYLKQSFSADIFINAQANLKAENVMSLFVAE
jgi:hypothetical protein